MEKLIPSSWRTELEDELTKLISEKDPASDIIMFNTLINLIDDELHTPLLNKMFIKIDVIKRLIRVKDLKNRPLFDSYLITVWRILVCPSERSSLEGSCPDKKTLNLVDYLYGLLGHTTRMSSSWDPPKGILEGKMVSYLNVQATTLKKDFGLRKDPLVLMIDLLGPRSALDYMPSFVKAWNKSYQEFPNFLQISGLTSDSIMAIIEDRE
uniref:Uncharacterized protein n=1 Tax=Marseillevirus LCMAC101 TaxID=2506602 RepID=A0A481YQX0_9VIRU|nr:MAG: hypothetical protein LCMAC101_00460 [Marseillevirus LCMAC101]